MTQPFPATHSLLAPVALAHTIAESYPLAPPVACALIRTHVNDVYSVATGSGRYILKVYRAGWRTHAGLIWKP